MKDEEHSKLVKNVIFNLLKIFNPFRYYLFFIEMKISIGLAFKVLVDALCLYIKTLPYLLIPLLILLDFYLFQPALTHLLSVYWQDSFCMTINSEYTCHSLTWGTTLNFVYYFMLWPCIVSPIYLSLYHAKMGITPHVKDLLKSSYQNVFKIFLLRILIVSVTVIVLGIIFFLFFYMAQNKDLSFKFNFDGSTSSFKSGYVIGYVLLFFALTNSAYILLRLFLAESLIALKGIGVFAAIKESWDLMSGRASIAFFSLILMWAAAWLLTYVLHWVIPPYSETIAFLLLKGFGAFYAAVIISMFVNSQDPNATDNLSVWQRMAREYNQ